MTKPFFPGLAGINRQREITARKDTSLEQLAVIGEDAIREYHTRTTPYNNNKENYGLCEELTRKLAKKLPPYTTDTLQGLVLAYTNQKESETKAVVRGLYTGILASQLTQKNQAQGKQTRIHLDGGNNSFPYLLYFAHTLDEVAITNFCGDNILRYAAGYGGHAGTITLANITGDNAGADIASGGGRVGVVTLAHITGHRAGYGIAENGRVGAVTLANITGDGAGDGIAGYHGNVGVVTLANITGIIAGANIAGDHGSVGVVTLAHITGHHAGAWIARNDGRVGGLFVQKNKGNKHFSDCDVKRISLHGRKNARRAETLLARLKLEQDPEQLHATAQELAETLQQVRQ